MNKKVLLIEDDADLFALVQYNLEKDGFAFCGSQSGKGALEFCRSRPLSPEWYARDLVCSMSSLSSSRATL